MSIPQTIGRYQINGEIGRGAMGVVYKATDPNIGRTVALKTMRVDVHGADEEEILLRFKHEAKLAGTMSHPNIVTVHDAGEDAGVFFMAMEYLEGVTLHSVLKEKHVLDLQRVIEIAQQVGPGLDYAHARGVIHRDIKPANIMCARNGSIKIMDFGIAKSAAGLTSAGQVLGTPTYMSPEQVRGKTLDGRSDLFSFGVILYEMVTGEKPFTGQNVSTIIYKIMNEAPIAPRDLDVTVHPGLSTVIIKALEKNPDDRYQNAAELVRDLENFKAKLSESESSKVTAAAAAGGSPLAVAERTSPTITAYESNAAGEVSQISLSDPTTTKMPGSAGAPGVETAALQQRADANDVLQSIGSTVLVGDHVKSDKGRALSPNAKQSFARNLGIGATAVLLLGAVIVGRQIKRTTAPSQAITSSSPVAAATTQSQSTAASSKPSPAVPAGSASGASKLGAVPSAKGKTTASVVLNSTPAGAAIMLDKKETGRVTPATLKLEMGHHEITLHKEFFRDASVSPTLKAGETFKYAPSLEPQKSGGNPFHAIKGIFGGQKIPAGKGLIQIKTKPPGAEIIYKGSSIEQKTPVKLPLDPGNYSIRLKLDGYRIEQKDFTVVLGKSTELNVDLQHK